jgi:hypothetical protein
LTRIGANYSPKDLARKKPFRWHIVGFDDADGVFLRMAFFRARKILSSKATKLKMRGHV